MMDYKRYKNESLAVTRNLYDIMGPTGNLYKSISVITKRANEINLEMRAELIEKINDFRVPSDGLEETFENCEQIEVARYYERLPKPTLMAINDFLSSRIDIIEDEKSKPAEF